MRIGSNLPTCLQNIVVILWLLGLAINFVTTLSGVWGWHPFLGWASVLVLVVISYDEKHGLLNALKGNSGFRDKLYAIYLLSITAIGLLVNVIIWIYRHLNG